MNKLIATLGKYEPYTRSITILASSTNPVDGEALTTWDLSRFQKNPVILWGHDATMLPVGLAEDVMFTPGVGLSMRVVFASAAANPLAEQLAKCVSEGLVRAVSVGYDDTDGVNALYEVSFVSIGADEDAGTAAIEAGSEENEDVMRAKVSYAARQLGLHRARARRRLMEQGATNVDAFREFEISMTEDRRAFLASLKLDTETGTDTEERIGGPGKDKTERIGGPPGNNLYPPPKPKKKRENDKDGVDDAAEDTTAEGAGKADPEKSGDEAAAATRTDKADVMVLDDGEVLRWDGSRLGKMDRTQVGGARIGARLSRTGILTYLNPDGTRRRELRLASEIFKADSLATLEHAPVIDIKDHTGLVTPETWRKVSLGHVVGVRQDGNFIVSDLLIQDQDTLDAIERGERTEISCGYRCHLDMTPGVYEGQPYDCIQRNIRYNHAALCPPNRGRAGPEVGLRFDTKTPWAYSHLDHNEEQQENVVMKMIRLDGRDYEVGSEAHIAKLEEMSNSAQAKIKLDAKTELDAAVAKAEADKKELQTKLDKAEGERDGLKDQVETLNTDAKRVKKEFGDKEEEGKKEMSKRILRKMRLMRMALRFFGDDDKEMDDKKMDAMDERDLMLACIKKVAPNFDAKDRSDDYVQSRFDSACEGVSADRGITGIVRAAEDGLKRLDAGEEGGEDPVSKARAERDKKSTTAWIPQPANHAGK